MQDKEIHSVAGSMKLHTVEGCGQGLKVIIAAKYANKDLAVIHVPTTCPPQACGKKQEGFEDMGAPLHPLGKCLPVLEVPDGGKLFGTNAMLHHMARGNKELRGGACGDFSCAEVDQWTEFCMEIDIPASAWVLPIITDTPACPSAVKKARGDIRKVMGVLNNLLQHRTFVVGERVTIADISLFCSFLELYRRVLDPGFRNEFTNLNRWFVTMANQPPVAAVVGPVDLCVRPQEPRMMEEGAAAAAGQQQGKKEKGAAKKEEPKKKKKEEAEADDDDEEAAKPAEKKAPNPLDLLPPSKMTMDEWKRVYSNEDTLTAAIPWFWEHYDPEGFSLWFSRYKFEHEEPQVFMVANGLTGWIQRLDPLRKYGFGSLIIFGTEKPFEVECLWLFRGKEIPQEMLNCDDSELYDWTRADTTAQRDLINAFLAWEGDFAGKAFNQAKIFK